MYIKCQQNFTGDVANTKEKSGPGRARHSASQHHSLICKYRFSILLSPPPPTVMENSPQWTDQQTIPPNSNHHHHHHH